MALAVSSELEQRLDSGLSNRITETLKILASHGGNIQASFIDSNGQLNQCGFEIVNSGVIQRSQNEYTNVRFDADSYPLQWPLASFKTDSKFPIKYKALYENDIPFDPGFSFKNPIDSLTHKGESPKQRYVVEVSNEHGDTDTKLVYGFVKYDGESDLVTLKSSSKEYKQDVGEIASIYRIGTDHILHSQGGEYTANEKFGVTASKMELLNIEDAESYVARYQNIQVGIGNSKDNSELDLKFLCFKEIEKFDGKSTTSFLFGLDSTNHLQAIPIDDVLYIKGDVRNNKGSKEPPTDAKGIAHITAYTLGKPIFEKDVSLANSSF